jgi:hypothetical protein
VAELVLNKILARNQRKGSRERKERDKKREG